MCVLQKASSFLTLLHIVASDGATLITLCSENSAKEILALLSGIITAKIEIAP